MFKSLKDIQQVTHSMLRTDKNKQKALKFYFKNTYIIAPKKSFWLQQTQLCQKISMLLQKPGPYKFLKPKSLNAIIKLKVIAMKLTCHHDFLDLEIVHLW